MMIYSCDRESERFHFATVLLHENPTLSQSNANRHSNNKRSTKQDQIPACHCMSLPTASQNTQHYLQAGYGLACAVASAEMALFLGALSLRASAFAVWCVGGVVFAVPSFRRRVFYGSIRWGRRLLRFGPLGASLGASSFAEHWKTERIKTRRERSRTCKSCIQSENQERMEGAQGFPGRAARGTCWWQCQDALTG
jgi:hypothetical protein